MIARDMAFLWCSVQLLHHQGSEEAGVGPPAALTDMQVKGDPRVIWVYSLLEAFLGRMLIIPRAQNRHDRK
jgi:hypothetical protein